MSQLRVKARKKPAVAAPPALERAFEQDDEVGTKWTDFGSPPTFPRTGDFRIGRADPDRVFDTLHAWIQSHEDLQTRFWLPDRGLLAQIKDIQKIGQWYEDPVVNALQQEVQALRARMARVEEILEGVDQPSFRDPDMGWCETHVDVLKAYPDSYVAIDTATGEILAHAKEEGKFIELLKALDPVKRKVLFTTHTSTYLTADAH